MSSVGPSGWWQATSVSPSDRSVGCALPQSAVAIGQRGGERAAFARDLLARIGKSRVLVFGHAQAHRARRMDVAPGPERTAGEVDVDRAQLYHRCAHGAAGTRSSARWQITWRAAMSLLSGRVDTQASILWRQRGSKLQPSARPVRIGGSPGIG